ncbi:MAG: cadmium-translocating P-type ATPase [Alphaproteobacteria bacterium]|nr:cadmium-translocating P-type ATPase [Alphaproteobacteria bacterium]
MTDQGEPDAGFAGTAHVAAYVRERDDGSKTLSLVVPDIVCAACISRVEGAARAVPEVNQARVNFSTKRLTAEWRGDAEIGDRVVAALADTGYKSAPFTVESALGADDDAMRELLRALGVAGFAAMNVMLLSVSVWAGTDMAPGTQSLFHWLSALIALPAVAYAGRPFYRGAASALRAGHLNMDVPISLAVILAACMSLYQTAEKGDAVYFDASIMLLFFLLLGRVLDLRVRAKARSAAQQLLAIRSRAATVVDPDGRRRFVRPEDLEPGMRIAVASGERISADGVLAEGLAVLDTSLLTGEAIPDEVPMGGTVYAGALNVSGPIEITVTASDEHTLLSEIGRLMEAAEQGRARYVRLADRVARAYAPAVHLLGLLTLVGWLTIGAGWETSLLNGIAVLIITCPCALALAVPAVQVVAGGRLLRNGVLIKSGDALERLADVDMVVFDKTGTLTTGALELGAPVDSGALALAAALAQESRHPLSKALVRAARGTMTVTPVRNVQEMPGFGLAGDSGRGTVRLGSRRWVGTEIQDIEDTKAEIWLREAAGTLTRFTFTDRLRDDAADTVAQLKAMGIEVGLLSGDRTVAVAAAADALGIEIWQGACSPKDKAERLRQFAAEGRQVLMVGDGLNDGPALAAAHVSLSPSGAADIAQNAADFVSLGEKLMPVADTIQIAQAAKRLVFQNFALSFGYNAVAIPIAILGFASPLIAAAAMSGSSLAVTLNALRLKWIS